MSQQEETVIHTTTIRVATAKGDLVLIYSGPRLEINGRLSTDKERQKIQEWAKEHQLVIQGSLETTAVVEDNPTKLQLALNALVKKEVHAAGFFVFAVDKKGRGRIVQHRDVQDLDVRKEREIAKVPQTRGGS